MPGLFDDDELNFWNGLFNGNEKTPTVATVATARIRNDFQPFERLAQAPFSLNGRPRSISVDSRGLVGPAAAIIAPVARPIQSRRSSFTPRLETIVEENDILVSLANLFQ